MAIKKGFSSFGWIVLVIGGLLLLFGGWVILQKTKEQIAFPIDLALTTDEKVLGVYSREASGEVEQKLGVLYGFLPYWNVDNYQLDKSLTHVSYFRLAVNGKGEIEEDGAYQIYHSEKWQQILQQVNKNKMKKEMTFFTSHSNEIEDLIACVECQDKLIAAIEQVVSDNQLDGVNLDLEYLGYVSEEDRKIFTDFVFRLRSRLDYAYPRTKLSIDVYGGAADMNNLWDFNKLAKIVDKIMLMGYDYKTKSSSVPGPTSPTLGKNVWGGDIWEDVRSLIRFVPAEKLILVVPFYGYAWETTTDDLETAKTYPDTGETLTYKGAQSILNDESYQATGKWDEKSLTPYLTFYDEENERWHIGFFENQRSLSYKMDLIEKLNLGGMAIWALGYEGEYADLWSEIGERF